MTQVTTYAVPNGPRAEVRAGINAVLAALRDFNAGASPQPNPSAGMAWLDTSGAPPVLRMRNSSNSGWDTALTSLGLTVPAAQINAAIDQEVFFINGGFDVWQRGTSFTSPGTGALQYKADR